MRKIIVLSFITLDGIMQGPGSPDEDRSDNFEYGGWVAPYFDEAANQAMDKQMQPADLLLGRKTFEIFENYWQEHADLWPGINEVTKYAVSTTRDTSDWKNTVFLRTVDDIKKLKESEGGDIQVHGSVSLVQTLLQHDLVDELWLKTFPVVIGSGKRLWGEGVRPAAFELTESSVTPSGIIFANYKRAGDIKTGTVGE